MIIEYICFRSKKHTVTQLSNRKTRKLLLVRIFTECSVSFLFYIISTGPNSIYFYKIVCCDYNNMMYCFPNEMCINVSAA